MNPTSGRAQLLQAEMSLAVRSRSSAEANEAICKTSADTPKSSKPYSIDLVQQASADYCTFYEHWKHWPCHPDLRRIPCCIIHVLYIREIFPSYLMNLVHPAIIW